MRHQIVTPPLPPRSRRQHCSRVPRRCPPTDLEGRATNRFSWARGPSSWSTTWRTARSSGSSRAARPGPSKSDFSIGHRGAALQFPEHTEESYEAGARMGAGILECDVTFTKDSELVCRHAQNDLHTTTNILVTPLAAKCTKPFTPAVFEPTARSARRPSAECCTSDITLAEFKTLRGKMDAFNPRAHDAGRVPGRHAELPHRPLLARPAARC